jgi:hypothetical protein
VSRLTKGLSYERAAAMSSFDVLVIFKSVGIEIKFGVGRGLTVFGGFATH